MSCAAIVLAAGGSSRLGKPKQLVVYEGQTLISLATENCIRAGCSPVIVVVGCRAEEVCRSIAHLPTRNIVNSEWRMGQSSSIVLAVHTLMTGNWELPDAVLVMLCDMPKITLAALRQMISNCESSCDTIIATSYPDGGGVPACFPKSIYPKLVELSGDQGAKPMIRSGDYPVQLQEIRGADFDVDLPSDVADISTH